MTPDARTAQRDAALATANARRLAMADVRREVAGKEPLAAADVVARILIAPDETNGTFRIGPLLAAVTRIGRRKVSTLLSEAGVTSVERRVRDLTPRQRRVIASSLVDWAERSQSRVQRESARPVLEGAEAA